MPFSQRSHVTSYLMWPCWWCQTRCCNVSQLGHHCGLPMPHSQNEYELLCLCSRSSNLTYEGYVSPNHRTPSQWPPPHRSDTDVQVTAPTRRAIIAARQAICRWGEEADNSGPCLSYNKQPQLHLTPRETYCFNVDNEWFNLSRARQRTGSVITFLAQEWQSLAWSGRIGRKASVRPE